MKYKPFLFCSHYTKIIQATLATLLLLNLLAPAAHAWKITPPVSI